MNAVEVTTQGVEPPPWIDRLQQFGIEALERLSIDGWEVSVLICDNETIHHLNRSYRGKDEPTDVLSFSQESPAPYDTRKPSPAGDIVISLETMRSHAIEFNVPEEEELKRLLIHGILHLRGMDHRTNEPHEQMLVLQEQALNDLSEVRIF